jgi:hypothetical protein
MTVSAGSLRVRFSSTPFRTSSREFAATNFKRRSRRRAASASPLLSPALSGGLTTLAIGGILLHLAFPDERPPPWGICIAGFVGALAMALWLANHFSKVRRAAPLPWKSISSETYGNIE